MSTSLASAFSSFASAITATANSGALSAAGSALSSAISNNAAAVKQAQTLLAQFKNAVTNKDTVSANMATMLMGQIPAGELPTAFNAVWQELQIPEVQASPIQFAMSFQQASAALANAASTTTLGSLFSAL